MCIRDRPSAASSEEPLVEVKTDEGSVVSVPAGKQSTAKKVVNYGVNCNALTRAKQFPNCCRTLGWKASGARARKPCVRFLPTWYLFVKQFEYRSIHSLGCIPNCSEATQYK